MMTPEEFVKALKLIIVDNGLKSNIEYFTHDAADNWKPKKIGPIYEWYHLLKSHEKEFVNYIIKESLSSALFNIFSILDHMHFIEDKGPKGEFKLYFEKNDKTILLNDPNQPSLTNLFKDIIHPEMKD